MTQNLISLTFSAEDLAAIHAAVRTLEEKLASLIELSVDERRRLNKMGDKTESACRQTLIVLAQNRQLLPPGFDLPEAERDLATLDQLRPVFARLRQLAARGDDTRWRSAATFSVPRSKATRWPRRSARARRSMPCANRWAVATAAGAEAAKPPPAERRAAPTCAPAGRGCGLASFGAVSARLCGSTTSLRGSVLNPCGACTSL